MGSDPDKERQKDERKREKAIRKAEKARRKTDAKLVKAGVDPATVRPDTHGGAPRSKASVAVKFADVVRGALYLLLGTSIVVAVVLGQRGAVMSLDEVIENLFLALAGKVLLVVIALGLGVYGLKKLGVIR